MTSAPRRSRIALAIAAPLALVIVLVLVLVSRRASPAASGPSSDVPIDAAVRSSNLASAPPEPDEAPPAIAGDLDDRIAEAERDLKRVPDPVWSTTIGDPPPGIDARWNQGNASELALASDDKGEILVDLSLDRRVVRPGEEVLARLKIFRRVGDAEEPVQASPGATVQIYDPEHGDQDAARDADAPWRTVQALALEEMAPGRWEAAFTPSRLPEIAARASEGRVMVWIGFDHNPAVKQPIEARFDPQSSERYVFLRTEHERLVENTLEVSLAVDVKVPGPTDVEATLYDAAGTHRIASYRGYFRPTATGVQPLVMHFFGRAIKERGIPGPFSIRDIHGQAKARDETGPSTVESWAAPAEVSFPTAAYTLDQLTDESIWDDSNEDLRAAHGTITSSQALP